MSTRAHERNSGSNDLLIPLRSSRAHKRYSNSNDLLIPLKSANEKYLQSEKSSDPRSADAMGNQSNKGA